MSKQGAAVVVPDRTRRRGSAPTAPTDRCYISQLPRVVVLASSILCLDLLASCLSTTVPVLPADHDVDESFTGTSSWVRDRLRARVYGQRTCAERIRILRTGDGDEIKAQGNSCRYASRPRSAGEYLDTSARSGVRNNSTSSYRRYSSVTVQRSRGVTPLPDVRDDERTRRGTRTSRRGKQCCYDS
jgi:hypothetical protein